MRLCRPHHDRTSRWRVCFAAFLFQAPGGSGPCASVFREKKQLHKPRLEKAGFHFGRIFAVKEAFEGSEVQNRSGVRGVCVWNWPNDSEGALGSVTQRAYGKWSVDVRLCSFRKYRIQYLLNSPPKSLRRSALRCSKKKAETLQRQRGLRIYSRSGSRGPKPPSATSTVMSPSFDAPGPWTTSLLKPRWLAPSVLVWPVAIALA